MDNVEIIGAGPVGVPFFCDVVKLLTKHFGKNLMIKNERMDMVRKAASVLEMIGKECQDETEKQKAK